MTPSQPSHPSRDTNKVARDSVEPVQISGDTQTLQITLANLNAKDVRFIQGVVSLFTDPARAGQLDLLRKGEAAIYGTHCGQAVVLNAQTIHELFYSPTASPLSGN